MARPRLLFSFDLRDDTETNGLFHSVYQEKEPLLSSGQQQALVTLEKDSEVCAVLRGLVCIKSALKIILCNPVTKKFLALPELRERYQNRQVFFGRAYLGYDEATDVFKVLCLTKKRFGNTLEFTDCRVFTVGSDEDCWRTIVYEPQHTPITNGICKDGVLYYGARSKRVGGDVRSFMMSFNLTSEELNVIELPKPIEILIFDSLVNYKGEIALVKWSVSEDGDILFWVRNETARDWRKEQIVIPRWRETVDDLCEDFCFKGTIGTGEFVFALDWYYIKGSMYVLYYDTITQHLRKFEIDGVANYSFHHASTFLDHIDSLSLM